MKEIMDKLDFIKIASFSFGKDNVRKIRRQAADGEKIFVEDTSDKRLSIKVYKDLLKNK